MGKPAPLTALGSPAPQYTPEQAARLAPAYAALCQTFRDIGMYEQANLYEALTIRLHRIATGLEP